MNRFIIYSIFFIVACLISQYSCSDPKSVSYDPPEGANYTGEAIEITLDCGDILAGTLTISKDKGKKFPCVLLITGSSPHDRDNSKPYNPITAYRPFRQIADLLSTNGIAVLRMDDRGIGLSKGGDINKMTTAERSEDIEQLIKYLKSRSDIDNSRIGLLGLSEGASIAHMIASKDISLKTIILLSAPGSKGKEILNYQISNGLLDQKSFKKLLNKDINLKYLYNFDPMESARLITQPTLIIHGESDKNVPPGDALKLKREMNNNGNLNVTTHILSHHNHLLLQENTEGKIKSTKIPDKTLKIILDWILEEL
ncbi:MAG: prolyl oligopeptidase family serine peptidase [Bacteroidetes bacterium]|nr:prolyl oligopeptidase family serine peptidase [Bacteroidota bacterium]